MRCCHLLKANEWGKTHITSYRKMDESDVCSLDLLLFFFDFIILDFNGLFILIDES